MEFVSKWSSSRAISKNLSYINTNNKRGLLCQPYLDSKPYGVNMGPTWGRLDPGGPHVGTLNPAIRAGNNTKPGVILCAGPVSERRRYK